MNATTGAQTGWVPVGGGSDYQPTWSKDGQKIVFASSRAGFGNYDIYTSGVQRSITQPTTVAVRLTTFTGDEQLPAYSR